MDKAYSEWRSNEIKRVGLKTQLEAESILDKQSTDSFVELNHGEGRGRYRKSVADALISKGDASVPVYYSMPTEAYRRGWDRIFGNG